MRHKDEPEETDLDETICALHVALREVAFHTMAAQGARDGLEDCFLHMGDPEISESADVALWANRVSMAYQAVADVAYSVSIEAGIVARIMEPTDKETEN